MTPHLRAPDLILIAVYLIGITLFGLRFRKKGPGKRSGGVPATAGARLPDSSLRSYFLANNTIPWWAISLSIVSAETSTLTIISIPGVAFAGDFGFLQIVIGYMIGRIVVAALFLPRYFSGNMLTAYQLIGQRFGPALHRVTAGLFLLTRAAAEGVRVFAVSIVVGIAIGTRDVLSIAIISILTLLYTFEGGMAAVIWTDVVQMAIYLAGTLVAIWSLGHHIGAGRSAIAGWHTIHTAASAAGKFHLFNFAFNLTTTYTFWAGILGGTFLTMASHGTDQLMVQRMLAARNLRESRLALLSSGVVIFIQFTLFLLIGVGLYVFANPSTPGVPFMAGLHPGMSGTAQPSWIKGLAPDRIFPTFIVRELPLGIAGLLVAAILAAAMSNLSAALNSLSSTTVVDFYMHLRPHAADRERNLISKSSTILWAIVLFAIAVYSLSVGGKGHVVEIGLSIASVAYGCLLGVFLLGTLTRFATEIGTALGMLCGFAVNLWLWQGTFPKVLLRGGALTPNIAHPNGTIEVARQLVPTITIPHIAFTWYVLIGALVTFALGSLFSLFFRKQSRHTASTAVSLLLLFCLSFPKGICVSARAQSPVISTGPTPNPLMSTAYHQPSASGLIASAKTTYPEASASSLIAQSEKEALAPGFAFLSAAKVSQPATPDFTPISTLLTDAIAAHHLPGAVVLIGHNNRIVFEQAYGDRKLAGEPGLDGQPSPAEPMTEDTIFDMASLSKCLSTATAIMQLYEAGKIASFDDPIEKYLPAFDPTHDPQRAQVTLRMLLTHTSGEAPDVDLRDPWGLAAPDRAEGLRLALTTPLKAVPGSHFEYSDINFILLGDLVETLSGEPLDVYAQTHIFQPLGMTETRYLPLAKACGPHRVIGAAIAWESLPPHTHIFTKCPSGDWSTSILPRIAPTTHDDESKSDPSANPHFDMLTRGTVHDPTTRRMGGIAGHAGVFSTAHDISLFASALLEKLLHNTGPFPLKQSTLQLMTQPEQPSHNPEQIPAANAAEHASIAAGDKPANPGLAPHFPAILGQNLRGFGWDIDTGFSKPRGSVFPIGSFGHTGFTGTSLWMDPASDTYVILLANAIHPRGNPPISNLRGQVATAAAQALGTYTAQNTVISTGAKRSGETPALRTPQQNSVILSEGADPHPATQLKGPEVAQSPPAVENPSTPNAADCSRPNTFCDPTKIQNTLTGIDVLESTHFAALANLHHIGLLTNQTGIDAHGHRTIDILHTLTTYNVQLTTLFTPEHGLSARQDTTHQQTETDEATHLPVVSLYGAHEADRRPTHAQLANLDAIVIDLQDAGVHFWTYEAAMGYFLEAASTEETDFHHHMEIVILDRPNPIGGLAIQGPVSDPGRESYINYMPLPIRHGLTFGELARYIVATKHLATHLTVVPMQHWSRSDLYAQTGLPWTNPSPNLRGPDAALRYPALGLIEYTNLSVGRGTAQPFSFFGAGVPPAKPSTSTTTGGLTDTTSSTPTAWFHATEVASYLTARNIPGVAFTPTTETIAEDANHYPFHGQTIEAVIVTLTDPRQADTPELGIEILAALHHLYPTQFNLPRAMPLVCNQATMDAIARGDDPRTIAASWTSALDTFRFASASYRLYP